MVAKVPQSHLLLISIATLSALQADIPPELARRRLSDVLPSIQWAANHTELDDACRSLNYILHLFLRHQISVPKSVIDKVPYLLKYLSHHDRHVRRWSNQVLNTIASGSDEESQVLLDSGILDVLIDLLRDSKTRRAAYTLISKFTAGNAQQIAAVMNSGIGNKLINTVRNSGRHLKTWRDAAWALANALDGRRSPDQFQSLVLRGAIPPLCKMLAIHSKCFPSRGDEGHLQIKTTERLLRCLDQLTIHLPSLQGPDFSHVPSLVAMIEEIFTREGYHSYERESKNGNG